MKNIIITLAVFTFMVSCKESENLLNRVENFATIEDEYQQFLDRDYDVAILIQRGANMQDDINNSVERISLGFLNDSMAIPNIVRVNDVELSQSNDYTYHHYYDEGFTNTIYGHQIAVSLDSEILTPSFYNAVSLDVSTDIDSTAILEEGATFTWNDDVNSKGVLFSISGFDPTNPDPTNEIKKEIILEDNGLFTIPNGWLSDFPDQTVVQLTIKRGNYEIMVSAAGYEVGVLAYSQQAGTYVISRQD